MTTYELLCEANDFLKDNKYISWKPEDFPEDMEEESTLNELCSEGDRMYSQLQRAVDLIKELVSKLDYYYTINC